MENSCRSASNLSKQPDQQTSLELAVQNPGVATLGRKDICGFDVSVDDALGVSSV